jgi:uncharacterized integral membrane protein
MSMRTLVVLLLLIALGVFVAANWAAFTTPTTLSLIVATVEAPLGFVMLGLTAAVAAVFLAYAFYVQASALRESRRVAHAIEQQRELADRAEASRFTELRDSTAARLDAMARSLDTLQQSAVALGARLDRIDRAVAGKAAADVAPPVRPLPSPHPH